jgi:hypothetical protein
MRVEEHPMVTASLVDLIMDYENGDLDFDETLELFTELVSSGMIDSLQGSYQRTAAILIQEGYIEANEVSLRG